MVLGLRIVGFLGGFFVEVFGMSGFGSNVSFGIWGVGFWRYFRC